VAWTPNFSDCEFPLDAGEACHVLFDNKHDDSTSSNWGWMNLDGWYPEDAYPELPDEHCSGPGTSELRDQILQDLPYSELSYGTPAWVCSRTGNTSAWMALEEIEGQVRAFPIRTRPAWTRAT
jgi:hypothetical protein